jgi:tight adherence protein B
MQALVLAVVFASVASLLVGFWMFLNRRKLAMLEAARERIAPESGPVVAALLRDEEDASQLPFLNRLLSGREWTEEIGERLKRAGVQLNPGAFSLLVAVTTMLGALIGARMGPIGVLAGAFTGGFAPFGWLHARYQRRQRAYEEQLPDAIDMLASALKSGYSFHAATNFLGQELAEPLGPQFSRMYDEQRLGIDARTALMNFEERVGSVDVKMLVTALLIQRETGGNLGEVLQNTSDMLRQRATIRGQLKTLTAEATYSARILGLLPVLVFVALSYMIPDFIDGFMESPQGQAMLVGAAVSVVLGYMIMMKIADVDY